MHELREGYAVVYISDNQMSEAKKQIQEIEDVLLSKFKLDEDLLWDMAMKKYKKDYSSVDLIASTGHYSEDGSRVAMMVLLGLDSIAKEVVGSSMDKDF